MKSFFRTYYAPNNAILSVVGDVKTADVLEKARKYFDRIPSQPAPPAVDMTEPPQTAEKRQTVDDPLAQARARRHRLAHAAGAALRTTTR